MGAVTSIILSVCCDEDFSKKVHMINEYLKANNHLAADAIYGEEVGGEKNLVCDLMIGAFNHLDIDELVSFIRSLQWDDPLALQLLVMNHSLDLPKWVERQIWNEQEKLQWT